MKKLKLFPNVGGIYEYDGKNVICVDVGQYDIPVCDDCIFESDKGGICTLIACSPDERTDKKAVNLQYYKVVKKNKMI